MIIIPPNEVKTSFAGAYEVLLEDFKKAVEVAERGDASDVECHPCFLRFMVSTEGKLYFEDTENDSGCSPYVAGWDPLSKTWEQSIFDDEESDDFPG